MTTDRIEINPEVMMGKPVVQGTRITVELLLRKLAEGATEAELLDAYPKLTIEGIRAAIAFDHKTFAWSARSKCDWSRFLAEPALSGVEWGTLRSE